MGEEEETEINDIQTMQPPAEVSTQQPAIPLEGVKSPEKVGQTESSTSSQPDEIEIWWDVERRVFLSLREHSIDLLAQLGQMRKKGGWKCPLPTKLTFLFSLPFSALSAGPTLYNAQGTQLAQSTAAQNAHPRHPFRIAQAVGFAVDWHSKILKRYQKERERVFTVKVTRRRSSILTSSVLGTTGKRPSIDFSGIFPVQSTYSLKFIFIDLTALLIAIHFPLFFELSLAFNVHYPTFQNHY